MALPTSVKYLVIGAGIHGLSTAYHLAKRLKARGKATGADIVVVDKTGVGAGASGIACGVVRNNYYQPAMRELMAHCVSVWERDPAAYSYHPVGYMQISPEVMHAQVGTIYEQQKAIGYESVFIEGDAESMRYMKGLFHDWQAKNITSVLHEKRGGYANNMASLRGLAGKASALGVEIIAGVTVTGFRSGNGSDGDHGRRDLGRNDRVRRSRRRRRPVGQFDLEHARRCRRRSASRAATARCTTACGCGTTWRCRKARSASIRSYQKLNDGRMPPVIHVDTDAPLHSDRDGTLITDKLWGIYYKPDFHFGGVQGGAMPASVDCEPDEVRVDPVRSEVAGVRRHRQLRRHVDLGARVLPEALRGPASRSTGTSRRAASAASRRTASRCSTASATTST